MSDISFVTQGKRILVALDGSVPSKRALENALSLGKETGAKIFLIRVLGLHQEEGDRSSLSGQKLLEELEKSLDQTKAYVQKQGLECETIVHIGPEIDGFIIQEAKDRHIDLIAMGTHGRTGLSGLLMGSVARKVICRAPCPVIIIPPLLAREG